MEKLFIEATKYTPEVDFNPSTLILSIAGKSYPENTFEFYSPINEWIKEFLNSLTDEKVLLKLDLEYLNSSSLKAFFDLFDNLEAAVEKGIDTYVQWIYDKENDISEETAEDFVEDFTKLNIELVVK